MYVYFQPSVAVNYLFCVVVGFESGVDKACTVAGLRLKIIKDCEFGEMYRVVI